MKDQFSKGFSLYFANIRSANNTLARPSDEKCAQQAQT